MNLFLERLLALYPGDAFALNAVRIALLASILAATALLIGRLARRDPALRYATGLYALFAALLSPVLLIPAFQWIAIPLPEFPILTAGPASSPGDRIAPAPILSLDHLRAAFTLLLVLWALGGIYGLARMAGGWRTSARLRRRAWLIDESRIQALQGSLERVCGPTPPPVLVSAEVDVPCVIGVVRPVVLLPERLIETLAPDALRAVLAHEFAHIVLRHPLQALIHRLTWILFWPHPLLHRLYGLTARAREEVCDNYALQVTGAACYARTLLTMAESLSHAPTYSPTLALLGPGWRLEERIAGLLDPRRNRMLHPKSWKLWMIAMAMAGIGASTASVHVKSAHRQIEEPLFRIVPDHASAHRQADQTLFRIVPDHVLLDGLELTFTNDTGPTDGRHVDLILTKTSDKDAKATGSLRVTR